MGYAGPVLTRLKWRNGPSDGGIASVKDCCRVRPR